MKFTEILWFVFFTLVVLVMTSCEKDDLMEDENVDEYVSSISKPTFDKYLVTNLVKSILIHAFSLKIKIHS